MTRPPSDAQPEPESLHDPESDDETDNSSSRVERRGGDPDPRLERAVTEPPDRTKR